jgi:tight adherence protein C
VISLDERFRTWKSRREGRAQIRRALPEAIDLLALLLQAGSDFQVALAYYVNEAPAGALREAFAFTQQEMQLGVPRVQALKNLAARWPEPSLRETVQTLTQGLELGSSLAPLLRMQAQALRRQRGFAAEKKAAQAPLQLLFPLLVFIFPTILLVLFGPLALGVMEHGGMP